MHSAVNEGGWRTAQHLELHPLEGAQSAPTPLLLQARRHSKLVAKSQGREDQERGWKRDGRQGGWQYWNQGGGGDKNDWWDKNKEKPGKDDSKEKKGDK